MTQLTQTAQSCIANVASRVMDVPADSLTIDALIYGMNEALVEAVQAGFSKAYIMEQWLARELPFVTECAAYIAASI